MTPNVTVISLGGSIIAPRGVDTGFLKAFARLVESYLEADETRKLIIVCGGGSLARDYQAALREVVREPPREKPLSAPPADRPSSRISA